MNIIDNKKKQQKNHIETINFLKYYEFGHAQNKINF
jgi:hypothetical protein